MLPNETPSEFKIRFIYPDIALLLESEMLRAELEEVLGLQGSVTLHKKSAVIRIPLTEQYLLILRPTDIGFGGYAEWMSWQVSGDEESKDRHVHSSVRASVEVVCKRKGTSFNPLTFTIHQENLEGVIHQALDVIYFHTTKRLAPKFIKVKEVE